MASSSENELPGLSNDESAQSSSGNMTDGDTVRDNKNTFAQTFMDQSFFYNLDQLSSENPLFFMQQQQQQQQQQQNFENQFLNKDGIAENRSVTGSLANSLESLRSVVAASTSQGGEEQPLSFWSGLNNFLSNVTHNNLFPAIPNIARSFSEYLANHPVPFLSSFNPPTAAPITSSPMASSSSKMGDLFKPPFELNNTGMQIRVLGVPQTGAKSRVETQIKLCIQLVTDGGDKALWWSHLKLPENMVTKDKQKKLDNLSNADAFNPEKMLYLRANVICASNPAKKVTTCIGCIQRERKRSQRRKENKITSDVDDDNRTVADDEQSLTSDEERILLFNCSEIVDFSAGDTILPTRITCYCRHHSEKVGFCIYFEMLDYTGKKVAEGISPPIMITDDHKSNKVKSGQKRRRTDSEATADMKLPIASNWMKSFSPFGIGAAAASAPTSPSEENKQGFPYFPFISSSAASTSSRTIPPSTPLLMTSQSMLNTPAYAQLQPQATYTTRPKMKRLIPTQASISGGIEVTILGTDFRPGMAVMFGDTPAKTVQYWSPNTLICTLPPVTQPGAVVVSFKDQPRIKEDVIIFTYLAETDRALMELALQVVGMKTTGVVEDARKIAMRIVQGNGALDNVKKE